MVITVGALISVVGSMNGNIFVTGQLPMAAALDGLAPKVLGKLNRGEAPWVSLVFGSVLASVLLLMNYSRGLVGAFTFLLMMATLTTLAPYLICALAELKYSWRNARSWWVVALVASVYALFAILGSGLEVIVWSVVLAAVGMPVYYLVRRPAATAAGAD
jgi:APA family basic amino acid/polyamine antiporter